MKTTESAITALGWEVETIGGATVTDNGIFRDPPDMFRASQGGFKTQWRPNIEQTLKDVQAIAKARKEQTSVPF